ncbi:MAG TPA: hypothetical protein VM238_16165 [Phycisphaerae bacterium]|nr:hypothetical protein [Phycisphaerae bacterium]
MRPRRILCIASGGGHLEQMLACIDTLGNHRVTLALYAWPNLVDFSHPNVHHLRFVRYFAFSGLGVYLGLLVNALAWTWIVLTERPDVIVSTGAEVAIAPIVLGKILFRRRTVFLESAARKENASLTGRVVYPFCDAFFVQSETLLQSYGPRARCVGSLL